MALQQTSIDDMFRSEGSSQYELYSKGRGKYAHLRVAATQTMQLGRDALQQDCQTDEVSRQAGGPRNAARPSSQASEHGWSLLWPLGCEVYSAMISTCPAQLHPSYIYATLAAGAAAAGHTHAVRAAAAGRAAPG